MTARGGHAHNPNTRPPASKQVVFGTPRTGQSRKASTAPFCHPRRLLCLFVFLVFALTLHAQHGAPVGAIQGTITDASGAPVPAARVTALDATSGLKRTAETNWEGRFSLDAIPPGDWTLHVEHDGFSPLDTATFPLSIGQVRIQCLTLSLKGVATTVDVNEQPDALEAAATTASLALGGDRIEEAPALGRNYFGFVALVPGLTQTATGGQQRSMTGIRSPLADSGFSFSGVRARSNGMTIDGLDNRDETTGVNQCHGDATWFFQNELLNARKTEVDSEGRPRFRRRQPGVSVMGPLRKDRTFWAVAAELEEESAQEWSETPSWAVDRINRALAQAGSAFSRRYPTSQRGLDLTFKLNHQATERDALALRYAWSHGRALGDVQGPENFLDRSAAGNSLTADHSLAATWLRVITPAMVNEIRAQYGRREQRLWPNGSGPLVEIPGIVSFGEAPRLNADRLETHAEFVEQ